MADAWHRTLLRRWAPLIWGNIPNALTLARLVSVPAAVKLIADGQMTMAFWLFIASGVTDALDGTLARLLNARTVLGAYMDPLADKLLLVSIYLLLGWLGHLPVWLIVLVVVRDLLIVSVAAMSWLLFGATRIRPLWLSKANTAAQLFLAGLVLGSLGLGFEADRAIEVLVWTVALTTVASGVAYLWAWVRRLPDGGRGEAS